MKKYLEDGLLFGEGQDCGCSHFKRKTGKPAADPPKKEKSSLRAWSLKIKKRPPPRPPKKVKEKSPTTRQRPAKDPPKTRSRRKKRKDNLKVRNFSWANNFVIRMKRMPGGGLELLDTPLCAVVAKPACFRLYCQDHCCSRGKLREILQVACHEQLSDMASPHNTAGFVNNVQVRPNLGQAAHIHRVCRTMNGKNWIHYCEECHGLFDRANHGCVNHTQPVTTVGLRQNNWAALKSFLTENKFENVLSYRGMKSAREVVPKSQALVEFESCFAQGSGKKQIAALKRIEGKLLFCFVLFCFVLFCFVLFCFVLFCFV